MPLTIDELRVADAPAAWRALGFAVEGEVCAIGDVALRLGGTDAGRGLTGWSLRDAGGTALDGLATELSQAPARPPAGPHPNGVGAVDHVVAISPDLSRTVAALEGVGLDLRLLREEPTPAGAPRQAFFRLGSTILEVVQEPADIAAERGPDRPAFFWGLALVCDDIEATVAAFGEHAGEVRDAVQPGRRIATLRRSAGLSVPIALISPKPARPEGSPVR